MKDVRETDEALAIRAQAGENTATEELLLRYKNVVLSRARRFFLQGGETDDLVQEGMIGLYGAIRSFSRDSGKSFKNYAYLCVTHRIYDVLRTAGRKTEFDALPDPDLFSEGITPEESLLDGEADAEFRKKLMLELSDFEFRVMSMYLEGMSYSSIADVTGKSMKAIDNALSRSKKKLQKVYASRARE